MNMLLAAAKGQRLQYAYRPAADDVVDSTHAESSSDLDGFAHGARTYFATQAKQPASVGTPYIVNDDELPAQEFTAMMRISGERSGTVYITASRAMLTIMLMRMGSDDITTERMCDALRGLAQSMVRGAREQLGNDVLVWEPVVAANRLANRPANQYGLQGRRALVTPIHWRKYTAQMVMSID